ncbi:DUF2407 C-terminal domain-containing protein [Xylaria sp. CBS 124048]|nr:DUF2407 C-terminal domain-containing protein [Xylaria sp. CBS 124048]
MTTAGLPKAIPAAPPPLLLTIRFSVALPDLELDIPRPGATTIVSLKHLIRSRLDKSHSRRLLRFIHGGKILPDTAVLTSVLRAAPPPPPPTSFSKSKGKSIPGRPEPAPRIYVNCSIGDELSTADLEKEAHAASLPPPTATNPPPQSRPDLTVATGSGTSDNTPRGFDRLLSTGFTASEVHQLRLQFRSIHGSRYTPDTLPSPDSFRRMEDAWIDDNGAAAPTAAATNTGGYGIGGILSFGGGGSGANGDEARQTSLTDVLIRGIIMGFVWPLGSVGWLLREDGMLSERWRFMVGVGIMFGVLIGFIRAISGDK